MQRAVALALVVAVSWVLGQSAYSSLSNFHTAAGGLAVAASGDGGHDGAAHSDAEAPAESVEGTAPETDLADAPILDEHAILTVGDPTAANEEDRDPDNAADTSDHDSTQQPSPPRRLRPTTRRSRRVDDPDLHIPIPPRRPQHHFLCVFVPTTFASNKDRRMSASQLDTWIADTHFRHDTAVFFVGDVLSERHREWTITIPGDMDLSYDHLPVRTFKMWKYLGLNEAEAAAQAEDEALFNLTGARLFAAEDDGHTTTAPPTRGKVPNSVVDSHRKRYWRPVFAQQISCDWYLKSDPDSYVNVDAIIQRLRCFDAADKHYFGVVHVVAPNENQALLFGHGGSGYMVSRGLLPYVGHWAPTCLADSIKSSDGRGMEDVLFSHCMRDHLDVHVAAYGHTHSEFVLNFHEAPAYILNGTRLLQNHRLHLLPPAVDECTLTIHPIETPKDMALVHQRVSVDPFLKETRRAFTVAPSPPYLVMERRERGRCYVDPFTLSKQAEVQLSKNDQAMPTWAAWQLSALYKCFSQDGRWSRFVCGWRSLAGRKYYGMKAAQVGGLCASMV